MYKKIFLVLALMSTALVQAVANRTMTAQTGAVCSIRPHNVVTMTTLLFILDGSSLTTRTSILGFSRIERKRMSPQEFFGRTEVLTNRSNSRLTRQNAIIKQPSKR